MVTGSEDDIMQMAATIKSLYVSCNVMVAKSYMYCVDATYYQAPSSLTDRALKFTCLRYDETLHIGRSLQWYLSAIEIRRTCRTIGHFL